MPLNVTNGAVNFLRRLKTGDYEHKEASVTLNFSIPEDMGFAEAAVWVEKVGQMAETKAHVMLGLIKAEAPKVLKVVENVAANVVQKVEDAVHAAANSETADRLEAALAPKPRRGRPPAVKPAETSVSSDPAAITDEPAAAMPVAEDDPFAETGEDVLAASQPDVSDADLIQAVTRKNGELRAPAVIKGLIGKFVAAPKTVRDIPQARRIEFLDQLAALTVNAA